MSLETRLVAFVQAVGLDVKNIFLALAGKQATLVSGTSIKTVNGQALLGSGDLAIAGGGGSGLTFAQTRAAQQRRI